MKPPIAETGIIESNREISPGTFDMWVHAPYNAEHTLAGQFVHVRVGEGWSPFLRRPLSVGPIDGERIRLIYTLRGRGTSLLAAKRRGDKLDMIGPLGKPYRHPRDGATAIMVAGGIGDVPLLLLYDQMPAETPKRYILGVRSINHLTATEEDIRLREIQVATDDGSLGFHGNAVQLLKQELANNSGEVEVYGCGPGVMLKALKELCVEHSIPAQVSLEVPMGCGLGACQSCAVPRADGDGYYLVCSDGPVFDASLVNLNPAELP